MLLSLTCAECCMDPSDIVSHKFRMCNHADEAAQDQLMCPTSDQCTWLRARLPDADVSPRHRAALDRLHSCTWSQCYEHLRAHMIAAAAKDCTVMLSISPALCVEQAPSLLSHEDVCGHDSACKDQDEVACNGQDGRFGGRHTSEQVHAYVSNGCSGCDAQLAKGTTCSAANQNIQEGAVHTCVRQVVHNAQQYLFRVAVVDLDCKPLSKVEKHMQLDREICSLHMQHRPPGVVDDSI